MPLYSFKISHHGCAETTVTAECRDDLDALDEAYSLRGQDAVEVWLGERLIARISNDDKEQL